MSASSDRVRKSSPRAWVLAIVLGACSAAPEATDGAVAHRDAGSGMDTGPLVALDGSIGAIDGAALDPASHGGTITFEDIGSVGWYPSLRDPASGACDAIHTDTCCMTQQHETTDALTPWDSDLIVTLRGPIDVAQLAVYQPSDAAHWSLVSRWDDRAASGIAFHGNGTETHGFDGGVGSECVVDVSTDRAFACGAGSVPYCTGDGHHEGWSGSKLFVMLARMPHATEADAPTACSHDQTGNWWDAPWIGLSLGELVRAGAFSSCQCYARDPSMWWLGDGCGQFNAFEVVNDNGSSRNLDVFSTNFFGYGGYVGEGPCGPHCDVSGLAASVDLIDKSAVAEAAMGAIAMPGHGPGAAFRRPSEGYRYFLILFDVDSRTVQLGVVHPSAIPSAASALLPDLPASVSIDVIHDLLAMRLPR